MSDLQQLSRAVDEVAERHPAGFTVDDLVKGGSRRRRRRGTSAVAGGAAALAAAAVVATGVVGMPGEPRTAPPAASSTTLAGCTLEPSTCDSSLVDRWADGLPGVTVETSTFATPGPQEADLGLAPGAVMRSSTLTSRSGDGRRLGNLDVLVVPRAGESKLWDVVTEAPQYEWQEREVPVAAGITAHVATYEQEGEDYEQWTVREGPGHGALVISYEGTRPDGWTEDELAPLVEALLTE